MRVLLSSTHRYPAFGEYGIGPHPKAFAAGAKAAKTMTDEVAVMIDARDGLDLARGAEVTEDKTYADSWKVK